MNAVFFEGSDLLLEWDIANSQLFISWGENSGEKSLLDRSRDWIWISGFISNRKKICAWRKISSEAPDQFIILNLYREFGEKAASYVFGTLSFIIWDSNQQRIIVSRDRIGNQGIYFLEHSKKILLGTRIQLFTEQNPSLKRLNIDALVAHINCKAPPPNNTFLAGIKCLEPATIWIRNSFGGKFLKYWQLDFSKLLRLSSDQEYVEAYKEQLFTVIEEYTPDEQLGIPLSSGLDSTTLAASIKHNFPNSNLTAFSWTAPELPESNEEQLARMVANSLGVPFIPIRADLLWPLSNPKGIETDFESPLYSLFHEAWEATFKEANNRSIKVLFLGLGGDHLFGGVHSYADGFLTGDLIWLVRQLYLHQKNSSRKLGYIKIFHRFVIMPIIHSYLPFFTPSHQIQVAWLSKTYCAASQNTSKPKQKRNLKLLSGRRNRYEILNDPLLPHFVQLNNLQAQKHNIEYRYPLLDHRLFEFSVSLPTAQTFSAGFSKAIMRRAMIDYLPNEIVENRKRTYPTAIVHRGLRYKEQNKVQMLIKDMYLSDLGLVDEKLLREFYLKYVAEQHDDIYFWSTLTLEEWLRRYF